MTEQEGQGVNEGMVLKLDAERRREIDSVRKDVENLMREDMKLDHKVDLMLHEQRLLKERIEEGISKTVWATSKKVDELLMCVGAFKSDKDRLDERVSFVESSQNEKMNNVTDNFKTIQDDFKIIYRSIFGTCFVALIVSVVKYFIK